ncbi:hypothetical protein ACP3BP_004942, partial [Escherichia coli]
KIDYLPWFHGVHRSCDGLYEHDNYYHLSGSFPVIRQATGRRPRAFSLFMKIFREKQIRSSSF